jgi:hypothetical protein
VRERLVSQMFGLCSICSGDGQVGLQCYAVFLLLHAAICVMIGGIAVYGGDVVMWFEMKCVGAAQ